MNSHALFAGNVMAHGIALMSGLASVVIAIFETVRKKSIPARTFWITGVVCLFVASDLAWQDEHRNTATVVEQKAAATAQATACVQDARVQVAYKTGLLELNANQLQTILRQQALNDAQQGNISSCVVSLGKMNPQVRRETRAIATQVYAGNTRTHGPAVPADPDTFYESLVIMTTNQAEPKASGNLQCEADFDVVAAPSITAIARSGFLAGTATKISNRRYSISFPFGSAFWGPNTPMLVTIRTSKAQSRDCEFTPQ